MVGGVEELALRQRLVGLLNHRASGGQVAQGVNLGFVLASLGQDLFRIRNLGNGGLRHALQGHFNRALGLGGLGHGALIGVRVGVLGLGSGGNFDVLDHRAGIGQLLGSLIELLAGEFRPAILFDISQLMRQLHGIVVGDHMVDFADGVIGAADDKARALDRLCCIPCPRAGCLRRPR